MDTAVTLIIGDFEIEDGGRYVKAIMGICLPAPGLHELAHDKDHPG
jgi:hypothetical protein